MLVAFLIMLREGLEAALIVGIVASYLVQTGRRESLPAVWLGVAFAAVLCLILGLLLDRLGAEFPQRQQELFEGVVAVIAAGFLASMVVWMRRAATTIKSDLQASVAEAVQSHQAAVAVAAVAFLAVGREGLESVFFLLATVQQDVGIGVPVGGLLGLATAVALGTAIFKGGARIDLRRFFWWTSLLIALVAAGLAAGAIAAFHEAGLWNLGQRIAFDLSGVLPADGVIGTLLSAVLGYRDTPTVSEVVVYLAVLVPLLAVLLWPELRRALQPLILTNRRDHHVQP